METQCACGCGQQFIPHDIYRKNDSLGVWLKRPAKFLNGHNMRVPEAAERAAEQIKAWGQSSDGRRHCQESGKSLGTRYNGNMAFATKHELILADKLKTWGISFVHNEKKFKRPTQGGVYVADFFIEALNLDVEVDGKNHGQLKIKQKDGLRDRYLLETYSIRTLRIPNRRVEKLTRQEFAELVLTCAGVELRGVMRMTCTCGTGLNGFCALHPYVR